MIQCKICGGSLQMNPDFSGATCPCCGVVYPLALLQRMAAEGQGAAQSSVQPEPVRPAPVQIQPVQPEPVRPVPVQTQPIQPEPVRPAPVQTQPVQPEPVRPAPVQTQPIQPEPVRPVPVQTQPVRPAHHIDNERFGLLPSEYRTFKTYPFVPQPVRPGLFAPAAVKADYEQKLIAWQAYKRQQGEGKAERDAYFDKFYEQTVPQYTVKEWEPYFEGVLAEAFPQNELRRNVPASDLFPTPSKSWTRANFVLMQGGRPAVAIYLASNKKRLRPGACKACISHGIPALTFHSHLSNRRQYIVDRVRRALNP